MQILTILLWDQLLMVREGFRWVSVGDFHEADFVWESSDFVPQLIDVVNICCNSIQ
jgi:hypothetical protein